MSCKNGTQLAYQRAEMRTLLALAAVFGFAYGLRDLRRYLKAQRIARAQQRRLEIWEGEGGAVPVAETRTAAQVTPAKSSSASPGGVT